MCQRIKYVAGLIIDFTADASASGQMFFLGRKALDDSSDSPMATVATLPNRSI